ncbi:hypothetical protein DC498_11155 [Terrimonas sp.]|uniref:DUF6515 family protein n=1 Tax=Terrimonas sp. TaxID=1914338 RepID=UPI000D51D05D|nr:DUF6515 family protein [Terrimonas sp.]PVD52273.1 hypothetical protein DC498_11155 [Terrimonas sp.]
MKKNKLTGMIFMFVIAAGSLHVSAQERNRGQSNSRPEVRSDRQPASSQKDSRRNVGTISRDNAQFKKEKVKVVATRQKPAGAERVVYNNRTYDYNNGRFYIENNGRYIQTPPPRGMRIKNLPSNYVRVNFGNSLYYFLEGVFYFDRSGFYEVVNPQIGTIVDALPADYEKVVYNGYTYYEYNGILYDRVTTSYGRGYQVVGYLE